MTLPSRPFPVVPVARPRVLIVDDSAVARAALSRMIGGSGRFDVRGAVADAASALAHLQRERVDLIVLDLEMPHTSGIEALPLLLREGAGARILIVSSAAERGAAVTLQALALGAADTLVKPAGGLVESFALELNARLALLGRPATAPGRPSAPLVSPALAPFDVIAIGASTGGIHALASLLGAIPAGVTQPILITQHLPPSFSAVFADQIAVCARRPCRVAVEHGRIRAGEVVVAAGDAHLVAAAVGAGHAATRLSRAPTPSGNLPAVDPMFASLAAVYGPRVLAIVLSGMGRDGLEGARRVRENGGSVVVQDRESSVVWGMPGAVAGAGLAQAVLAPEQIGALIARSARRAA